MLNLEVFCPKSFSLFPQCMSPANIHDFVQITLLDGTAVIWQPWPSSNGLDSPQRKLAVSPHESPLCELHVECNFGCFEHMHQ